MWQFAALAYLFDRCHEELQLPWVSVFLVETFIADPTCAFEYPSLDRFVERLPKALFDGRPTVDERCLALYRWVEESALECGFEGRLDTLGQDSSGYVYYYLGDRISRVCREQETGKAASIWETVATDALELESFLASNHITGRLRRERELLSALRNQILPEMQHNQRRLEKLRASELIPRKRSSRLVDMQSQADAEQRKREEEEQRKRAELERAAERRRVYEAARQLEQARRFQQAEWELAEAKRLERERRHEEMQQRRLMTAVERERKEAERAALKERTERLAIFWREIRLRRLAGESVVVPDCLLPEEFNEFYVYPPEEEREKLVLRFKKKKAKPKMPRKPRVPKVQPAGEVIVGALSVATDGATGVSPGAAEAVSLPPPASGLPPPAGDTAPKPKKAKKRHTPKPEVAAAGAGDEANIKPPPTKKKRAKKPVASPLPTGGAGQLLTGSEPVSMLPAVVSGLARELQAAENRGSGSISGDIATMQPVPNPIPGPALPASHPAVPPTAPEDAASRNGDVLHSLVMQDSPAASGDLPVDWKPVAAVPEDPNAVTPLHPSTWHAAAPLNAAAGIEADSVVVRPIDDSDQHDG